MKCLYCEKEMEKGVVSFMAVQGVGSMIRTFTSDDEMKKSFFKRKTQSTIILPSSEEEAYHCSSCKVTITITKEN
ncbi:MAG: PF20097 family protein [Oscillospiraceae bacterium]|nr:PF20097 family protein [Oscillospiraceae bacterium]